MKMIINNKYKAEILLKMKKLEKKKHKLKAWFYIILDFFLKENVVIVKRIHYNNC